MTSRKIIGQFEKWLEQYNDNTNVGFLMSNKYDTHMCSTVFDGAWQACTALHEAEIEAKDKIIAELENSHKLWNEVNNDAVNKIVTLELDNKRLREALQYIYVENESYITLNNLGAMDNQYMVVAREALATPPTTKALDKYWNQAVDACVKRLSEFAFTHSLVIELRKLKKEV